MEKDTLDLNNIVKILGERPFPSRSNFKDYLETKQKMVEEESPSPEKQVESTTNTI